MQKTSAPAPPAAPWIVRGMFVLFVLVAFVDSYPWLALSAVAALTVAWVLIDRAKRAWKSGTTQFEKIMNEELNG